MKQKRKSNVIAYTNVQMYNNKKYYKDTPFLFKNTSDITWIEKKITFTNKKMKKENENNLKHALDPLVWGMGINGAG